MDLPNELTGTHALVPWLNKLLRAVRSQRVTSFVGGRVIEDTTGTGLAVGTSSGFQASRFLLQTVQANYVTAHKVVGSTEGSDNIYIAKPKHLRTSLTSANYYGTTHTFTYPGGDPDSNNLIRNNDWTASNEDELVYPPWSEDDEIFAIPAETNITAADASYITWIMVAPWRQWAKIA